jgi:hypothetical protein
MSRRVALAAAGLAGGGLVSVTLMACYGAPCVSDGTCPDVPTPDVGQENDGGTGADAGPG